MLPVVPNDFWLFKNELPFFVLLWCLICPLIFPSQHHVAVNTMHIGNSVETRHEMPVFFRSHCDVHGMREQKSTPMSSLLRKFGTKQYWIMKKYADRASYHRLNFRKAFAIPKFNLNFSKIMLTNELKFSQFGRGLSLQIKTSKHLNS